VRVAAAGVLTGWGRDVQALPHDARVAANGRAVIPLRRPAIEGDRFRRATRECLLGVAAVEALLADGDLSREAIRGSGTALVYVTATAYTAANRAFIEQAGGSGTLHFPYTAPSAVPAEVAIEFGLTGPYVILIGATDAGQDALWQGAELLARRACERVLVLAVETVEECADLFARGRWLTRRPLVEAAVAVLLTPDGEETDPGRAAGSFLHMASRRAGETFACAPLIALALARAGAPRAGSFAGR
jgi:3-oxoacyl-(acyl-carrier-protein) synthase